MASLSAYFLVGPTGVGKTAVGQWLAEETGYDILSADSMSVYAGMDIGTAKPEPEQRRRVRYHCLDLLTPDRVFSVWEYRRVALECLASCAAAGRGVVVVGGSGLYVKSLTDGLDAAPPAQRGVREYWVAVAGECGVEALQEAVRRRDPRAYRLLADKRNPRRLVRALEMIESRTVGSGRRWREGRSSGPPLLSGLAMDREDLKSRIELRVASMYRAGLVSEARKLIQRYGALSETARHAIGYAEALAVLEGRCSEEQARARTAARTRRLAKRQDTWFRHQARVHWIQVERDAAAQTVGERVLAHWSRHGPAEIAA